MPFVEEGHQQWSLSGSFLVQKNGKIVVMGRSHGRRFLIRYLKNGQLDHSFGKGGIVHISLKGQNSNPTLRYLAETSSGDFIITGTEGRNNRYNGYLVAVKFLDNGKIDREFGWDGFAYAGHAITYYTNSSLIDHENRKIYTTGYSGRAENELDYTITSFDAQGNTNEEFGPGGIRYFDIKFNL